MPKREKCAAIGAGGAVVLVACWLTILFGPYAMRPAWVPHAWLAMIGLALPAAMVAGVVAGAASRWWYVISAVGLLTAATLLAAVA